MLILAVDTSTKTTSLALLDDDEVRASWHETHEHPPSDAVFPRVEEALARAEVSASEIEAFAACTGPGSFTGLRIGLGLAKTMAWVGGSPVVGVDAVTLAALEAVSSDVVAEGESFFAAVHGFRKTTFSARFTRAGGLPRRDGELAYHDDEEGLITAVGSDRVVTRTGFPFALDRHAAIKNGEAPATILAREALRRIRAEEATPFHDLQPLYLKPFSVGKKGKTPEDLR